MWRSYGNLSFFEGGIITTKIYLGGNITTSKNYGGIKTTYAKIEWRNYNNL
jgi:hypothetical protein